MVHARRADAGVTTAGGCTALAAAAIMLAACGGHTVTTATTSPAASSSSAQSSSPAAAATGSVRLPAQLLGLQKNTSATAKQAATIVSKEFASGLTGEVVGGKTAIYGGEQNGAAPFFFVTAGAWAQPVASPENVAHPLQEFLRTKGFADARWRSDLTPTASAQVAAVGFPASSAKKAQVKAPIYPLWLLAGSLPGPSGWRLQNRLTPRVSRQASCVAESSRSLDQERRRSTPRPGAHTPGVRPRRPTRRGALAMKG